MKILVADNDPSALDSITSTLWQLGWPSPGKAESSDAAIEWINQNEGCDLLISEVYLSPADGFTLRETVQPHLPGMKTLFVSSHDISPYADRLAGCPFLPKPISIDSLREPLNALIGPSPNAPVIAESAPATAPVAVQPSPSISTSTPCLTPIAKPATAVSEHDPDELAGTTLGHFRIEAKIGDRETKVLYRAKQTNIDRSVVLYVLKREAAKNPEILNRFIADYRAKARISHLRVSSVYEAGEFNGLHFYTCENVASPTLQNLLDGGGSLDFKTALQIIKMVADVLDFLVRQNIEHTPIEPQNILLKPGTPMLDNIGCDSLQKPLDPQEEKLRLGEMILKSLDSASSPARQVAKKLTSSDNSPLTWHDVSELAAAHMPKAAPADIAAIEAQTIAMKKAIHAAKAKNRRLLWLSTASTLALTAATCFVIYKHLTKSKPNIGDLGAMVEIPAGEFQYQDQTLEMPGFLISKYEVTIFEYAKFLKYLQTHPEQATAFDSPKQPKGKSHIPVGWADMKEVSPPNPGYYNRAKHWGQYNGSQLTLDSPVFGVDWFDAYAYAKWKGHRLPTEQEWERAARGDSLEKFPWGDENNPEFANTGIDFTPSPDPKIGGDKDGFKRSSPVNAPYTDKSPFGVQGLAGNVSEWTASFDEDPQDPRSKIPVIRGGNWKNPDPECANVTRRVLKLSALESAEMVGFRTVSDLPKK